MNDMDRYIPRKISSKIAEAAPFFRAIVVTGPRQVGKTTLCKHLFPDYLYFNLEDPSLREFAISDPKTFLANCSKHAIIDEVQNIPQLLSYIQVAIDEDKESRYILTGSNNFSLMQSITQSLAGRAAMFTLLPFAFDELGDYPEKNDTDTLIRNGLYPAVIADGMAAEMFFKNYYSTYVERDVRQLMEIRNFDAFQKFMRLCAGRIGTELNMSSLGVEVGMSAPTIREWMSILNAFYITFSLPPYYANINKRLTKTPKLYFYDTGLACFLLGIENDSQLATHPLRGALFENLAIAELLKGRFNIDRTNNLFFYRENSGREVDIVQTEADRLKIFEVKSSKSYNSDFRRNLDYMATVFGDKIASSSVIYDGTPMPPALLNIRDI